MNTAPLPAVTADPPSTRPRPTDTVRRVVGALALPLAFVLQLAANVVYALVSSESGLSDTGSGAETLELYGRYPSALLAATTFALAGVLVMIPGLLGALRVLRPHRPRLALVSVSLMIAGYVCYVGIVTTNGDTLSLARYALEHPDLDLGTVLDTVSPAMMWVFALFVLGNLVGTLLLGLTVLGSPTIPRVAGPLIMCWTVGHVVNIAGGGEWFAVAGGALEVAGLCLLARGILRDRSVA